LSKKSAKASNSTRVCSKEGRSRVEIEVLILGALPGSPHDPFCPIDDARKAAQFLADRAGYDRVTLRHRS